MYKQIRNILLVSGIIGLTVGIMVAYKKINKKFGKMIEQYSQINLEQGVIATIPATKLGKYDVIFIWGGLGYATPEWMMKQVPLELYYANIIIFSPYNIDWSKLNIIYKSFLQTEHLSNSIAKKSLIGFSAGGTDVYENYSKKLKFVGLIDPSTKSSYANLPFSKNTYMVYNDNNWGGYVNTQKALPTIAKSINDKGGFAEKVTLSHKNIPKYFFNKFQKQIR